MTPIRCPRCGQENPSGGAFCIFCGSPLAGPAELRDAPSQGQPPSLEEELREVQRALVQLTDRIAALERLVGISVRPSPQPSAPEPPAPSAPTESVSSMPMGETEYGGGGVSLPPIRLPSIDWEQVLGMNWLAIVGAVALAIGMGFFLKLAFDNNWIGPAGRVILGIATGVALLGGGEFTQRRYPRWAQAVTGGGIGILYLSIYASFGFYKLIDPVAAFAFLGLVVVVSGLAALRYESLVIALLGISGAFLTPILLGRQLEPAERYLVVLYIILVDAGILGVSTFRNWRWFTLIGLLASYALYALMNEDVPPADLVRMELGVTATFLIFAGATTLFHIVWRRMPQPWDVALMALNSMAFFGTTYGLLWAKYQDWFGSITLALSFFYGLVGYGAIRRTGAPPQVALYSLATALVFLTIAVPLQLSGSWITVAWAAEGVVLLWVGFVLRSWPTRAFGLGVLAIAAFRLLVLDTPMNLEGFRPFMNTRFPTFLFAIAAFYVAAYLYWRERGRLEEWETNLALVLAGAANLFTIWVLSAEVISYFDSRAVASYRDFYTNPEMQALERNQVPLNRWPPELLRLREMRIAVPDTVVNYKQLALTALWAIYAFGLLAVALGKRSPVLRWAGLGLLAIPVLKLVFYDAFVFHLDPRTFILFLNFQFLTFLLVVAVVIFAAYLYWRQRDQLFEGERYIFSALLVMANLVALWSLSAETVRFFDSREVVLNTYLTSATHLSLTVLWAVYAIGIIAAGIVRRSSNVRLAGLALLAIPVAKLFVFDVFLLERGYRVAAFITLGVLLLSTGLAYQRYSQTIRGFLFGKQT